MSTASPVGLGGTRSTPSMVEPLAPRTKTLFEIGFFTTQNPARLMQRLRRLYSRTRLEDEEINILRGMLTVATEYNARLKRRYAEEHPDVQKH